MRLFMGLVAVMVYTCGDPGNLFHCELKFPETIPVESEPALALLNRKEFSKN